jgi:hypothetical protein
VVLRSHSSAGWRDPDSNRGHHDFQAAAKTRTTGAVCRGLPELNGAGDAGGFQAIPGALGHATGLGDPKNAVARGGRTAEIWPTNPTNRLVRRSAVVRVAPYV